MKYFTVVLRTYGTLKCHPHMGFEPFDQRGSEVRASKQYSVSLTRSKQSTGVAREGMAPRERNSTEKKGKQLKSKINKSVLASKKVTSRTIVAADTCIVSGQDLCRLGREG